jgi:tetratricopeptide (TPR) repeat protein
MNRIVCCGVLLLAMTCAAQGGPARTSAVADARTDALATEANAAYEAKDWAKAAKLYEELSKTPDPPPRVWYRLGVCRRSQGKYEEALGAFDQATKLGGAPFGDYGKAATYAAMKQSDKAFEALDKAMQAGYNDPEALAGDTSLASLHGDPRFAKASELATKNQKPCAYAPENRQFDFWLGEWDVSTTNGSIPAGTSKIELILGDCVVQENWKSLNLPYSGKSYNIYDAALKRWEQYWVDNGGGNIFFHGGLKDGVMDYYTDDLPQATGPALRRHLQFFKLSEDKVRQFSQGSTDGGKTWAVEYDFTYVRKK